MSAETSLADLRLVIEALDHRVRLTAGDYSPGTQFATVGTCVDSADLHDGEVRALAERIAREGAESRVWVEVRDGGDTLASYGGSAVLRAYCQARYDVDVRLVEVDR